MSAAHASPPAAGAAWFAGLRLLARSQRRYIVRHPVGAVATLLGVALAVLAVTAVHQVSASVRVALAAAGSATGWHTHVATKPDLSEADYFDLRRQWRAGALPGVDALYPIIDGYVRVGGEAKRLVGFDPLAGMRGVGDAGAWEPAASARDFLLRDLLFAGPEDVRALRSAGDRVADIPVAVRAVEDLGILLADLPTAQRLLRREGALDAVWLRVDNPRLRLLRWADGLLPGIAAALPEAGAPAIAGFRVTSVARWNPVRRFADASAFNLGMLALLCLLMAAFLAVQTHRANIARRALEQARLIAVGATPSQLRAVAVAEGLLVGGVGTALGFTAGLAVANALAEESGMGAVAVDSWLIAKALLCGALASTLAPCWAGRRLFHFGGPELAVRHRWWRHLGGVGAAAVVAICLVDGSLPSAFTALLLLSLLHVAYLVPALAAGTRRLGQLAPTMTMRANLRSAPAEDGGDARLALAALSIAAAVAIGMGLMVESLRRDFHAMLDRTLWEGVYLRDPAGVGALDLAAIRALPGAGSVRRYGEAAGQLPQGPVTVRLADLDAAEAARYGVRGAVPSGAFLNEAGARAFGLGVGDVAHVTVGDQRFPVHIVHTFQDYRPGTPTLILPRAFHAQLPADAVAWNQVAVVAAPGMATALAAALRARYPNATVRDSAAIRATAQAVFDRSFAASTGLTLVVLAVAVVGLYAALAAQQAARVREFRLLAAVGHTRRAIWRLALTRTAVHGAVAAVAAVPLGLAIAWVLCAIVNPQAFGWAINLRVDAGALGLPLLLCLAAALAAGAVPSYRVAFRASG